MLWCKDLESKWDAPCEKHNMMSRNSKHPFLPATLPIIIMMINQTEEKQYGKGKTGENHGFLVLY